MPATVVVGGFFGDEGKGKIISYLALAHGYEVAVRGGVGPNAGHTVIHNGEKYKLRMLPSTIVSSKTRMMIGPGVLVDPRVLLGEIAKYKKDSRVLVDPQCSIIDERHLLADESPHLKDEIGTTGTGTGPANAERVMRTAKLAKDVNDISHLIGDVPKEVNNYLDDGKLVLVEGSQGTFLSLYHGTYPYVTSKDVTASAICSDVGLGPKRVDNVIVVFKGYVTRVGAGPLDGELSSEEREKRNWSEIGTVTGRARRTAPFDFDLAKRSIMLNGATSIALTKLDIMFPECSGVRDYAMISDNAKAFIEEIESGTGSKVSLIGTGPEVLDTIERGTT